MKKSIRTLVKNKMIPAGAISMAVLLGMAPQATLFAATTDTIDPTRTGSISIHKYDITTAEEKGAYTAGSIKADGNSNSTVENALKGYEIEGVEFSYLRVGDVETHDTMTAGTREISLVYEVPVRLAQILGLNPADSIDMSSDAEAFPCKHTGIYHYTSQKIGDAMAGILRSDNIKAKNELESYLKDGAGDAVPMAKTDANGFTSASGLSLGLYLLVETEVPEDVTDTVDPWLVQLPFTDAAGENWSYDMTCYPKNQTGNPTLDKGVLSKDDTEAGNYDVTATASEGDILDYVLVSKMPHITSEATWLTEYTFEDTLSKGLTYMKDAQIYFYHSAEDAEANQTANADENWKAGDGYFTVDYATKENGEASSMKVSVTDAGLKKLNARPDQYIVVSYSAQLNSDAAVVLGDEGNPNDVQLTWRRTSDSYYNTLEDRSYVYSYGVKLTKAFSDGQGDFSKVHFVLQNTKDQHYLLADKVSDGCYRVTGKADTEAEATVFVPEAKSGIILVDGMEADSYLLTETATDSGYSLLRSPIQVEIQPSHRTVVPASITLAEKTDMTVGEVEEASASIDGKETAMDELNAHVVLTVNNSKGFLLPQTGGSGLYLITILGVMGVAGGSWLLLGKRHAR